MIGSYALAVEKNTKAKKNEDLADKQGMRKSSDLKETIEVSICAIFQDYS